MTPTSLAPATQAGDYLLDGKPYLLARIKGGRAWHRTGVPDAPGERLPKDAAYGAVPDTLDHPEVWDDWSGGFGDAYRDPGRPNRVHWSENMDTRFPRQMVHCQAPVLPPMVCSPFHYDITHISDAPLFLTANPPPGSGSVLVHGVDKYACWAPDGLTASSFLLAPTAISGGGTGLGRAVTFGSFYYMPRSDLQLWQNQVDGLSGKVGSMNPGGFAVAGDRLWGYLGTTNYHFYVQSATTQSPGLMANWSATLGPIGNGALEPNDIVALNDQVFLGLPNGLYAGDLSGTFFDILGDLQGQVNKENCRELAVHQGEIIVPWVGGMFAVQPTAEVAQVREIGPQWTSNRSPIQGYARTVRSHGGWLYQGLWTGSVSYILAGRDGPRGFDWHVMQRLPHTAKIRQIHVDSITVTSGNLYQIPNRMWVATDASIITSGTSPLYVFAIPRQNGNPLVADPLFTPNYAGSARADLPYTDWRAPGTPKVFRQFEVWADNLLSGVRYCDVYYTVDSGSRTLLGRVNTGPRAVLYFTTNPFVTGQAIAMSLESFTASATETPIYRAFVLRGSLRPNSVDIITALTRIADGLSSRNRTPLRPGKVMLGDLRALATQQSPVQLIDLAGATSWVVVLPPIEEQEIWQQGSEFPEVAATVKMAVQRFS